jgi:catechol 2,3-dioxygenase-like lactoylglutathione lyase family enzyme
MIMSRMRRVATLNRTAVCVAAMLIGVVTAWAGGLQTPEKHPATQAAPAAQLINTCLISANVDRLVAFYEPVLGLKAQRSSADYAEFHTGAAVLAIFSATAQQQYIPGSAQAGKNKSVVLEFRVADVDKEYARLKSLVKVWVKTPTTQPWGTRSIYFRDPDGNLVDFYGPGAAQSATPVSSNP